MEEMPRREKFSPNKVRELWSGIMLEDEKQISEEIVEFLRSWGYAADPEAVKGLAEQVMHLSAEDFQKELEAIALEH